MFFQHLDSNSDSPYSWICSWRRDTNVSPESVHIFGVKNAFDVSRVQVQLFPLRIPTVHSGKLNVFFFKEKFNKTSYFPEKPQDFSVPCIATPSETWPLTSEAFFTLS